MVVFDLDKKPIEFTAVGENSEDSAEEGESLLKPSLQNDKEKINEGTLINEALNHGLNSFTPDIMFSKIVKNYEMAEQLYGEKLMHLITGYSPQALKKNLNLPEFQRELQKVLRENITKLKDEHVLNEDGSISDQGIGLASFVLYLEELDHIIPKGWYGRKLHKDVSRSGDPFDARAFRRGDRYRDLALQDSIKLAIRRGRTSLKTADLMTSEKRKKGMIDVVYGIDASGSMRGKKIEIAKKAGIALSYNAIQEGDSVGLISFGAEVRSEVHPTKNFSELLHAITRITATKETDFTVILKRAVEMFPNHPGTKHLIIISDALPTVGKEPEKESLEAVGIARARGITTSLVGINLDRSGTKFAKELTRLGDGRFYLVNSLENVDRLIIEDYYRVKG